MNTDWKEKHVNGFQPQRAINHPRQNTRGCDERSPENLKDEENNG